jgi:predicted Fe-S protein YdhL (DUF1289 family)
VTQERTVRPAAGPVSPCINVCVLDDRNVCQGCLRTIDEIADWGRMSATEQWAVIERLERAAAAAGTHRPARAY